MCEDKEEYASHDWGHFRYSSLLEFRKCMKPIISLCIANLINLSVDNDDIYTLSLNHNILSSDITSNLNICTIRAPMHFEQITYGKPRTIYAVVIDAVNTETNNPRVVQFFFEQKTLEKYILYVIDNAKKKMNTNSILSNEFYSSSTPLNMSLD